MHKGLLAALAGAAALMAAGQAAAATFTLDFTVSSDDWMQFHGSGQPFGLGAAPVLNGSLTGDTSLLTTSPGAIVGGTEMLTDFHFTAGSQTFTLADIDATRSSVHAPEGGNVTFNLVFKPFFDDLGSNFVGSGGADLYDGVNDIACLGCVSPASLTWSGLAGSAAIPEPASWALLLLGFFGLGATLRLGRRAEGDQGAVA